MDTIPFPLERSVKILGRITAGETPTLVRFVDVNRFLIRDFTVDREGYFTFTGFEYGDSLQFVVQAFKGGRPASIKNIEWVTESPPGLIDALGKIPRPQHIDYAYDSRVQSRSFNRLADSVRMLEEVVIKAPKIVTDSRARARINRPDFILQGDAINRPGSLIQNMAGKVPGLIVECPMPPFGCRIFFGRAIGSTITGSTDPLILLNDNPVPLSMLADIDPVMVDRVEVTRRINVLYGDQGADGIIAVYTREFSVSQLSAASDSAAPYSTWVKGLQYSRGFTGPQYGARPGAESMDDRVLLFWQPGVFLSPAERLQELTFYSADVPTRYRINVRGLDESGRPVESVFLVEVK